MADSASVGSDLLARLPRAVAGVPEIRWEAVHIAGQGSELHASESATVLRGAYEGKAVAVKDLPLDADPSCDAEKLAHEFLREAAVHASCNAQPTVVKLVGYALQRDVVHGLTMLRLVMPLGLGPLADHVNHDRLDLSQRLDWALQVALGTMGLHKRGVNHQGLKLTNIILFGEDSAAAPTSVASDSESPAGSPAADPSTLMLRLSDIGHAAVRAKNDLPGPSDDCLDFTAPELLEGESATPAADVWSLGLVIYAILARSSNPWAGLKTAGSDFSLFMARSVDVKGVRPDLGKLDPGLAAAGLLEPVAALLQRCWQMDPRARSTAPDVARALKDVARSLTRANTSNTTTTATAGAVGGAGASQQQPSNTSADCADPTSNTSSIAAPATASGTAPLAAAAAAAFNNAKPAAAAPTAGAVIPTAAYAPIAPSPQALAYAQVQCFAPLPTFSAGAAFSYPATHWAAAPTQGAAVGGAGAGGGAGGAGPSLHPTGLPTYEIDGSLGAGLGSASASHAWTAISLAALMLGTVGGPQAAAGQGFADPMSPDPAPGCLSPAASEATFASEKLTTTALLADPDLIDKVTVPQVIAPTVLVTAPLAAVVGAGALPSLAMTASVSSPAQTLTSSPAPSAAAFAAAFAGAGVGNIFNASELERPTDRTTIAQVVDVAFVMDCTASMTPHIEKCKTKLVEIAEGIVAKLPGTSIKFAFVGYRDFDYGADHFAICPFGDASAVATFVAGVGMGSPANNDIAEDVAGGVRHALNLPWRSPAARLIIHFGDMPAHGRAYHDWTDPGWDNYQVVKEEGKLEPMMRQLAKKRIDYYFMRLTQYTDKMTTIMAEAYDAPRAANKPFSLISDMAAADPAKFVETITECVTSSISASRSAY